MNTNLIVYAFTIQKTFLNTKQAKFSTYDTCSVPLDFLEFNRNFFYETLWNKLFKFL